MAEVDSSKKIPTFAVDDFQVSRNTKSYIRETLRFTLGSDDKYFATYWKPKTVEKPKGLVFICHGFAEYFSSTYDELSEALVENGHFVFGHDHIGYGRSTGERAIVKTIDEYVLPVLAHVKKVKNDFNSEVPISIIGHSMGGLITVHAAMAELDLFHSIVLMSPLIKIDPKVATPIKKTCGSIFSGFCPSLVISSNHEKFGVTRDLDAVNCIKEDTLGWHGGIKLGLANVLMKALKTLKKPECLKKITVPLLVLQGGQDEIVWPEGASFIHDNVASASKKLLIYEEAYHNLYCELEEVKSAAIKETCNWIDQHS